MRGQDLLPSPLPSLSEQLRQNTDRLRSRIARINYNSQFARTAPELAAFRHATAGLIDGMDDNVLSETFRKTVGFTTYTSYAPLMARFLEKPCKANDVADLLAPGLPDYLLASSSTSGGLAKLFPKYNIMPEDSMNDNSWSISDPHQRRTKAYIRYFWCDPIHVEDEDGHFVKTVYLSCGSTMASRAELGLRPEKDGDKMAMFILDHAAPYAAGFTKNWRSLLVIHALFTLGSKSLKTMHFVFIFSFVDLMRHIDMQFDMFMDCIANGAIPDLDGIADTRHYLEMGISPDPERAEELRHLGRPSSRPGWCAEAWPNLQSITAIAGGSFAMSIPLARWFLGPDIDICDEYYANSEAGVVAHSYNPLEMSQYKPANDLVVEFLDINKDDSTGALVQLWEVELGKRYELVLTTPAGLWRYRVDDVFEVAGFDPEDGVPIIRFIERRNVALRFSPFTLSEEDLRATISFMAATTPMHIVDWTATIDDRRTPGTIGLFVEVAGELVADDLARAADHVLDQLARINDNIVKSMEWDVIRKPTIRVVRPGTFIDFRQLKLDEGTGSSNNVGQIKVPVVLPKVNYVTWFSARVMQDSEA